MSRAVWTTARGAAPARWLFLAAAVLVASVTAVAAALAALAVAH
jgi:hypothetical protein